MSRSPADRSGEDGFTLIEVLVAFVVAALCVTVVLESMSASMDAGRRAQERLAAVRLAQSLLAAAEREDPKAIGAASFAWSLDVEPLAAEPGTSPVLRQPQLARIAVRVTRGGTDGDPLVVLETIRPAHP